MLKRFQKKDCKALSRPMVTSCKLIKDDISKEVDQILYIFMIEILLYVTTSITNVIHVVGHVAHFQAAPK